MDTNTLATRLDSPPPESSYIELPKSFGRRFALFVDTEEEFNWSRPFSRTGHTTHSVSAIPGFQKCMEASGVQPVYLVDYAIASDPEAVELLGGLQDSERCSIGAHLHPWINPPHDEVLSVPNSFAGNLPPELERAKLERLTEKIQRAFGQRPTTFRAGRYGVGPGTAQILAALGYRVDTSIRPHFNYSKQEGPNFNHHRPVPFKLFDGALLEVPLTSVYLSRFRRPASMQPILARLGLARRVALTPEGTKVADAREAIDVLLDDDLRLFSVSFHSPSLSPGNTPFVRSSADVDSLHAWCDSILDHFARRGVEPASIGEIEAAAKHAPPR